MTPERLEYELNYWKLTFKKHKATKYIEYLSQWNIQNFDKLGNTLEIGTGPFLGVLPLIIGKIKVGIDPNYNNFEYLNMLVHDVSIICVNCAIEDDIVKGRFNTIFMADGVEPIKEGALSIISNLLVDNGRLYLHLHLRDEAQLNKFHTVTFSEEDLNLAVKDANLTLIWRRIFQEDPIPQYTNGNTYRTVMGLWTK